MQKRWKIIKYQKFLFLDIIVSFRPILWSWSHNTYKLVSTKFRCYYVKICFIKKYKILRNFQYDTKKNFILKQQEINFELVI